MNIQLRITKNMKETGIEMLGMSNRANNLLKRMAMNTLGDIADKWQELKRVRGMGVGTLKEIQNAVVNFMISEMSDDELVEWFGYLVENNPAESLRPIYEGLNAKEVGAA